MGDNLEKSVKVFEECRRKGKVEVLSILRFHKTLPQYLLNHYRKCKIVSPDDLNHILTISETDSSKSTVKKFATLKDNLKHCLSMVESHTMSLAERSILLLKANSLLAQYLSERGEDHFYQQTKTSLKRVSNLITIQELIIEYLEGREGGKETLLNDFTHNLFDASTLQQFLLDLKCNKITIIFLLLMGSDEREFSKPDASKDLHAYLRLLLREKPAVKDSKKSLLGYAQDYLGKRWWVQEGKWSHLEQNMKVIAGKSKVGCNQLI